MLENFLMLFDGMEGWEGGRGEERWEWLWEGETISGCWGVTIFFPAERKETIQVRRYPSSNTMYTYCIYVVYKLQIHMYIYSSTCTRILKSSL